MTKKELKEEELDQVSGGSNPEIRIKPISKKDTEEWLRQKKVRCDVGDVVENKVQGISKF